MRWEIIQEPTGCATNETFVMYYSPCIISMRENNMDREIVVWFCQLGQLDRAGVVQPRTCG